MLDVDGQDNVIHIIVTVIFSYFVFKEKLSKKALADLCLMVVDTLPMVFLSKKS